MKRLFQELALFRKPGRYLGREPNLPRANWEDARLRFLLAYPDTYEIGMSSYGYQLIYSALSSAEGVFCDRAFLPDADLLDELTKRKIPIWGLASRRPAREFDVVGFSLHYELCYTNLLWFLKCAQIPLFSGDRGEGDPIVVAGGPCASNPAPLEPFIDAFFIGEWDTGITEATRILTVASTRSERLHALSELPGVYVPGINSGAKKRFEPPSIYPFPPLIPLVDVPHNRITVEIARGCSRGCRFCHAGFIYRPTRERDPDEILRAVEASIRATGFNEVSLLSLSATDYSFIEELMVELARFTSKSMVSLSIPSFRAGTLTPRIMEAIKGVKKTGFTIAPEAGTQRLRDAINKGITEEEIMETVEKASFAGWKTIKLYFMLGLPTETWDDVDAVVHIINRLLSRTSGFKRRPRFNITLSPFVPKPHTPFQWEAQEPLSLLDKKISHIKRRIKKGRTSIKSHNPKQSLVEALLSRGDSSASRVLYAAFTLGARFDQWGEHFSFAIWKRAMEEAGMDPEHPSGALNPESPLPWDRIDYGISKKFLLSERERAKAGQTTPSCNIKCSRCGICQGRVSLKTASWKPHPITLPEFKREKKHRLICYIQKKGEMKLLGQNDLERLLHLAMRRAEIPLAYSSGFTPHPAISFAEAVPLGVEVALEPFEVGLWKKTDLQRMFKANRYLPEGVKIVMVQEAPSKGIGKLKRETRHMLIIPEREIKHQEIGQAPTSSIDLGDRVRIWLSTEERPAQLLKRILTDPKWARAITTVRHTRLIEPSDT